jgi:mRNA-degrading endonuclease RelE of RelBE toxin-antitoxin system
MNIAYAKEFVKQFNKLPSDIQNVFKKQELLLKNNWRDPRLQTKKLINFPFHFSFRVTRAYRVIFIFSNKNSIILLTIGHRKDVYR